MLILLLAAGIFSGIAATCATWIAGGGVLLTLAAYVGGGMAGVILATMLVAARLYIAGRRGHDGATPDFG